MQTTITNLFDFFSDLLIKHAAPTNTTLQDTILSKINDYCGKPVTDPILDEYEPPYQWTFYHSVFFAFTVCSTLGKIYIFIYVHRHEWHLTFVCVGVHLGYGNIAPTTTFSRYFMIVYALIGMPVNGILFAYLGDFFGSKVRNVHVVLDALLLIIHIRSLHRPINGIKPKNTRKSSWVTMIMQHRNWVWSHRLHWRWCQRRWYWYSCHHVFSRTSRDGRIRYLCTIHLSHCPRSVLAISYQHFNHIK